MIATSITAALIGAGLASVCIRAGSRWLRRAEEVDQLADERRKEARRHIEEVRADIRAGVRHRDHGRRFSLHPNTSAPGRETHVSRPIEQDKNSGR